MHKYQIVWTCGLDPSGYSSCARNYCKALHANGFDVKIDRKVVTLNLNGLGLGKTNELFLNDLISKPTSKPYVRIHHSVPDKFWIDRHAEKNIGYTVVETEEIPKRWVYFCNKMDAIFTASNFCKDVFINSGITVPVYVIPHCLDIGIWNKNVKPIIFSNNTYPYKFLFSGDMTERKGFDELLDVWNSIKKNNRASLTIKGYFSSFNLEDQNKLKEKIKKRLKNDCNPVFFYGHCMSETIIPRFYKSFDFIVSPHKGEGFGLIPFEGMALGVMPIITNATGSLEYSNKNNSILINVEGKEKCSKKLYNINKDYENVELIKIDKNHLKSILEDIIYNNNYLQVSNEEYNQFLNRFSYESISQLINEKIYETIQT